MHSLFNERCNIKLQVCVAKRLVDFGWCSSRSSIKLVVVVEDNKCGSCLFAKVRYSSLLARSRTLACSLVRFSRTLMKFCVSRRRCRCCCLPPPRFIRSPSSVQFNPIQFAALVSALLLLHNALVKLLFDVAGATAFASASSAWLSRTHKITFAHSLVRQLARFSMKSRFNHNITTCYEICLRSF